ncbi:MAG: hypothetical protein ACLFNL_10860 [Bacteroidales bacterium]
MAKPKFQNTQTVYLKIDEEQFAFMVTGIVLRPEDYFEYLISDGTEEFLVREAEITVEKQIVI